MFSDKRTLRSVKTPSRPPSLAHASRDAYARAFATVLRIPAASIFDAPPSSATRLQFFQPAAHGGIGCPDPAILAHVAHLGSVADTLPLLNTDPYLSPALSDRDSWPNSPSPDLSDAISTFSALLSLPRSPSPAPSPSPSAPPSTLEAPPPSSPTYMTMTATASTQASSRTPPAATSKPPSPPSPHTPQTTTPYAPTLTSWPSPEPASAPAPTAAPTPSSASIPSPPRLHWTTSPPPSTSYTAWASPSPTTSRSLT